MARNKRYIIKVGLEWPEYKFIQQITKEDGLSQSEAIRRIIITFNVLTSRPLYRIMQPLDFSEGEEKNSN